jgi:hypothetical protein
LGILDKTNDTAFENGMRNDAQSLGDPAWDPRFPQEIHGVFLVTGETRASADQTLDRIKDTFLAGLPNAVISEVLTIIGDVRKQPVRGFEQFVACMLSWRISTTNNSL